MFELKFNLKLIKLVFNVLFKKRKKIGGKKFLHLSSKYIRSSKIIEISKLVGNSYFIHVYW